MGDDKLWLGFVVAKNCRIFNIWLTLILLIIVSKLLSTSKSSIISVLTLAFFSKHNRKISIDA